MTDARWRITDSAIDRYHHARGWSVRDPVRARRELTELMPHAAYQDGVEHLERWRSPRSKGSGLRWLIDARSQSVVWVGHAAPPIEKYLDDGGPKPGRGGPRVAGPGKRIGRPLKADAPLDVRIDVRVTAEESGRLEALAEAGHTARDVLLAGVDALTPRASRS